MVILEKIVQIYEFLKTAGCLISVEKDKIIRLHTGFQISAFGHIGEWFASLKVQLQRKVKPKRKSRLPRPLSGK